MRLLHVIFNIRHYGRLKMNREHNHRFGIHRSVVRSLAHQHINVHGSDVPWLDRPGHEMELTAKYASSGLPAEWKDQVTQWPENGYLILGNFFAKETCDRINSDIQHIIDKGLLEFDYTNSRIMNAWKRSDAIRAAVKDDRLISVLSFLLGKKVAPFQTISFQKGSQQRTHSDFIHMTTEPKGYLIAVWIALEDITPTSGPLHYYPGSHKLPYILGYDFPHNSGMMTVGDDLYGNYEEKIDSIVKERRLQKKVFLPKKGDLLVWHANLLHGGEQVTDPASTRKSLVAHYFSRQDVLCYHEITQRPAVVVPI